MKKPKAKTRFKYSLLPYLSLALALAGLAWVIIANPSQSSAAVDPNGTFFYGDTSGTNQGVLRARGFTFPSTANAEFNGAAASSNSFILWTIAKTAPTREETMIGILKVNGTLDIQTCTSGCDANGDFTARWNNPNTTATQDCDATPTIDTCIRAFDIAYEPLSGRGFVVYGDNAADTFYYARWDGSAWSPNTAPGTPDSSNDVDLPGSSAVPNWIRVIPAGESLDQDRSNRMMVLVADKNSALHAFYWDGSSFDAGNTVVSDLQNCNVAQCFDGAWSEMGLFVLSYVDNDATNNVSYMTYTVGTGWGTEQSAHNTANDTKWLASVADPTSTRILVANSDNGNDTRSAVWRGNNTTNGFSNGCVDNTTEVVSGMQAYAAFERFNGEGLHLYNDSGTTNTGDYCTYTPAATWGTPTPNGLTTGDDSEKIKAWGSPNSDDIMMMGQDVDCDIDAKLWVGTGWSATMTTIEADSSHYGVACPNNTGPQPSPEGAPFSYDFVWKNYASWQRNWRFYDDADTASTPATALAAENTALTNFGLQESFRLRMNYAERGAQPSTDARRKLQYTSDCNPNSTLEVNCTWTDVDDIGGTGRWRYQDISCTPTDCADTTQLAGTVLSGSGACTAGNGCGTWVLDKDASASGTSMDHNSSQVQESEWIVEANWPLHQTTYYFRIWDVDQATPLYREQDSSDCGSGGASACTYPSITTGALPAPTQDQVMRHGSWFSGGYERHFYWAD